MKKTKKALASLAIAGMSLSMIPFNVFAAAAVPTRIAGLTAEDTAAQIADQTGYKGTAILASSTSYGMVDALTAGPLAASLKAPILLTGAENTLNASTKAELTKLEVKTVYVTSGTAVIKQGVIDELKAMGIEVIALGGYDRAETSVNIAKKMTGVTKVAVANGIPDALSIASIAAAANEPILLTNKDALPASVAAYLTSAGITSSDIIGGTGIISDAVQTALPGATRHAGLTAYDTNNQVIKDFAAGLEFGNVYVANGVTGIDALAGAPLAAQTKSPIVLTDGKTVPAVAAFTYSKAPSDAVVTALGGTAVVSDAIRAGVAAGQPTQEPGDVELAIVNVSALDDSNKYVEIVFSKPVSGLQASDITIKNADTQARYGVKAVQMSANGLTATVELYAQDDAEQVLAYMQDYSVTVNVNGTILTTVFNRPFSAKVRVQDINPGDDELVAYFEKASGDKKAGTKVTINVPSDVDFDYQAALGELVQVWFNEDYDLVSYKILTTDAKTDSIEVTKKDEIKLLSEDKKYDISEDDYTNTNTAKFAFYVDGEQMDIEDDELIGEKYNFAKIGFNSSGDIEFVSAYNLRDVALVDSVDGDEVVGVDGTAGFDGEDFTIIKDGKVVAPSDLEKGDLVFYSEDADGEDGYAEVLNKKIASGEIDEVFSDSIEVDGDTYDYIHDEDAFEYNRGAAFYINEDGDAKNVDSDAAEELQAAGDVTLYGDYAGNLIYIGGDTAEVESNAKVAVLTKDILGYKSARDKVEIEALTQDEDEVSYDMNLEDIDTITVDGEDYDIDNSSSADSDWNASLIKSGDDYTGIRLTENDGDETVDISFSKEAAAGSLVKLHLDDNGNLEELEFFSSEDGFIGVGEIKASNSVEAGDKYINGKKLKSDTIMFDATEDQEDTDADDYNVIKFGDYDGAEIDNGHYIYNDDAEVVAIWYDHTTSSDYTYDEAMVTKVLRNTDKEIVSVTVYAGGKEQTYKVDEVKDNSVAKGDVVVLKFDEDNNTLVKGIITADSDFEDNYSSRVSTGLVVDKVDIGNKKVTFTNGKEYKLADNGLVLDAYDNSDITIESLSDLRGEKNVTVVLDAKVGSYAKLFVMEPESEKVNVDKTALQDAITAAEAAVLTAEVSVDGTDIEPGTDWVTQADQTALKNAIAVAKAALNTVDTNAKVTAAVDALETAVTNFEAAKKDGTKQDVEQSDLQVVTIGTWNPILASTKITVNDSSLVTGAFDGDTDLGTPLVNDATHVTVFSDAPLTALTLVDTNGVHVSLAE